MKKNSFFRKGNEDTGSRLQNILLGILVLILPVTLIAGTMHSKKTLAKNKVEYDEFLTASKTEESRINSLNVYERIVEGRDINILILGDNIGDNSGVGESEATWYDTLKQWFKDEYNTNVGITNLAKDNTTLYSGYNSLNDLDLSKFDLTVLAFDLDGDKLIEDNIKGIYETIIKKIKSGNEKGDIVPVIQHNSLSNSEAVEIVTEISEHYNLQVANMASHFSGKDGLLSEENNKPNGEGHNVFFNVIKDIISVNIENKKNCNVQVEPLHNEAIEAFNEKEVVTNFETSDGFEVMDGKIVNSKNGATAEFNVNSRVIGLSYMTSVNGGTIEVYLDNRQLTKIDTASDKEEIKYVVLANNFKDSNTIRIVANGEENTVSVLGLICNGSLDAKVETTEEEVVVEDVDDELPSGSNNSTNSGNNTTTTNRPNSSTSNGNNSGSSNSNSSSSNGNGSTNNGGPSSNGNGSTNSGDSNSNGSDSNNNESDNNSDSNNSDSNNNESNSNNNDSTNNESNSDNNDSNTGTDDNNANSGESGSGENNSDGNVEQPDNELDTN